MDLSLSLVIITPPPRISRRTRRVRASEPLVRFVLFRAAHGPARLVAAAAAVAAARVAAQGRGAEGGTSCFGCQHDASTAAKGGGGRAGVYALES